MQLPRRLLTWLLIIASIAVDAVLLVNARYPGEYSAYLAGLVLGQVGALAIWAAASEAHRLTRGTILVLVTAAIALLTGREAVRVTNQWLGLLAGYAFLVCMLTMLVDSWQTRRANEDLAQNVSQRWRIPLIEFFGWTIVAAIVSFGARHMAFDFLQRGIRGYVTIAAILFIPIFAKLLFASQFRRSELLKALLIVAVAYGVGLLIVYQRGKGRLLTTVMTTQAAYLAIWSLVQSIENSRMPVEGKSADDADSSNSKGLQLFEAED